MWLWAHRCFLSQKPWNSYQQFKKGQSTFKQRQTSLFWWRYYAISINLIVGSYMVATAKTLNFMSARVYEISRGNQNSNKEKYLYSADVNTQSIRVIIDSQMTGLVPKNLHIDVCFHKNLGIHVSSSLSNKQKHLALRQRKMLLFWYCHHAKGINLIIGSWMVASTKTLKQQNHVSSSFSKQKKL